MPSLKNWLHPSSYRKVKISSDDDFDKDRLLKQSLDGGQSLSASIDELVGNKSRAKLTQQRLLLLNIIIFTISLLTITTSLFVDFNKSGLFGNELNKLLKLTSESSPILNIIDVPLLTKRMNGTLLEVETLSIYRQPPSPEVDAAWNRIQTRNPIPISLSDLLALGKDPSDTAKFPESFGFGPDAYIGKIDVFHQIHCLNMLRMSLRPNFDYYYGSKFPPGVPANKLHNLHLGHCLHILLENLMCSGNVDIYTHYWMDAQKHAFPDFNINHKCRDFDAILAWQEENSIPVEKFATVFAPPGQKVHVMSHEFKEAFEWYDADHPDDGIIGGEVA